MPVIINAYLIIVHAFLWMIVYNTSLKVFFFISRNIHSLFFFLLGCRRILSPDGTSDFCRFTSQSNMTSRPINKTQALGDSMIGGTVVGSTGGVAMTQIGMCVC
jgi:hypothetical protein